MTSLLGKKQFNDILGDLITKAKPKELTSRSQGRNVRVVMQKVKVYIRGWLGYFGIASNLNRKTRTGRILQYP